MDQLARDRMMTFQELADEAFRDLLVKHGRPTNLKEALRKSAKAAGPPKRQCGRARARSGVDYDNRRLRSEPFSMLKDLTPLIATTIASASLPSVGL